MTHTQKEKIERQKLLPCPFILWLLGVPGSGKSTLAKQIAAQIPLPTEIIDSDEIRSRLTPTPTWHKEERTLVYRAIWEIARLLYRHDVSVIIAASAGGINLDDFRHDAPPHTFFVHLKCDLDVAAQRHPKRLYHSAADGTGIRLPILRCDSKGIISLNDEEFSKRCAIPGYILMLPRTLDLEIDTSSEDTLEDSVKRILKLVNYQLAPPVAKVKR